MLERIGIGSFVADLVSLERRGEGVGFDPGYWYLAALGRFGSFKTSSELLSRSPAGRIQEPLEPFFVTLGWMFLAELLQPRHAAGFFEA